MATVSTGPTCPSNIAHGHHWWTRVRPNDTSLQVHTLPSAEPDTSTLLPANAKEVMAFPCPLKVSRRRSVQSGAVMFHIEILESSCPAAKYVPSSPSPSPEIARADTGIVGEDECAAFVVKVV